MRGTTIAAALTLVAAVLTGSAPASARPVDDDVRTPVEPVYTVSLSSSANGFVWTGHEDVTFTNASTTPLPEVYLRLWDNYHGKCPTTPITVRNVTGGTASALSVNCTAMKITLPAPLAAGRSASIGFDLTITVPAKADRFGRNGPYSYLGNALPVLAVRDGKGWHLDPYSNLGESFYTVAGDFTVKLDHPSNLSVPATGTSVDAPGAPGRTVTTATATKVRDFAWGIGAFTKISGVTAGGVAVNVHRTAAVSASLAQSMRTVAIKAIDAHAGRLGAYPYREADVVLDKGLPFGGMEYPGFVLSVTTESAVAHELAHQWFYGIVGNDEYNDPWLDESFTDHLTDLYYGDSGEGCGITWDSPAEKLTNSMAYWGEFSWRYSTVVYSYGSCTLHDLRRLIGETAMANLLRGYAQSHWYGVSTVADFKAAAQQAAGGKDLTAFWAAHRVEG